MMPTYRFRLTLDDVLPVLTNVKRKADGSAVAACPICEAGDSRGHHLYLSDNGDKLLVYCQKCNAHFTDLLPKFEELGARHDEPKPTERTVIEETSYEYRSPTGETEYYKLRRKFSDGSKTFVFAYRDENEKVITKKPDNCDNLYNLDKMQVADADTMLYIVEGEKCADAMTRHGFLATTANTGAQKQVKLSETDKTMLQKFKNIILIPDNDEKGADYAGAWPVNVQVLPMTSIWPKCPKKGDIADFFQYGGTADKIRQYKPLEPKKLDAYSIISKQTLEQLYSIRDPYDREQMYNTLQLRAKELRATQEFKHCWKAFLQKKAAEGIFSENSTQFPPGIGITFKSGEWVANETGIYKSVEDANGKTRRDTASPIPILPVAVYRNYEDNTEKVKLAFYKDGNWNHITVPRSIIASTPKIVNLADYGISVNSNNAKYLVQYIADIMALNPDKLIPIKSSGHMGWVEKKFLPYDTEYALDCETQFRSIVSAIHSEGDLDAWILYMDRLRENTAFRLTLDAAFSSPLVEIVGALPYVYHLFGGTGSGKTVALMCAASIYGNPAIGALVRTLNSTINAMITTAYVLHNIPFYGDELQTIKNREGNYDTLLMQVTEGVNRGRMTSGTEVQKRMDWRNVFMFTGEEPATNPGSGGGVYNRVIEAECTEPIVKNGGDVVDFIRNNYGYAGRKYIENLPDAAEIKKLYRQYTQQLLDRFDTTEKQAISMGLILTADAIANRIFWPNTFDISLDDIGTYLKRIKEVDAAERAYSKIIDCINENINRFDEPDENPGAVWGTIKNGYALFNKSVLERELNNMGFNFNAIKRKWLANGYIEPNSQGRIPHNTSVNGEKGSYIKILIDNIKEL